MSNTTPFLISREDAAQLLGGISLRHLDRLCARGDLTKRRVGGRAMIVHATLAAYADPAADSAVTSEPEFPLPPFQPSAVGAISSEDERAA
jgi:hypothetical protein